MNLGKALVKAHYITLKYSLKISEPKILPFLDYTSVVFACLHFYILFPLVRAYPVEMILHSRARSNSLQFDFGEMADSDRQGICKTTTGSQSSI